MFLWIYYSSATACYSRVSIQSYGKGSCSADQSKGSLSSPLDTTTSPLEDEYLGRGPIYGGQSKN